MSTITGSEEQEVSGSDSDRYTSCRESFDSEASPCSGKDSPAMNPSPSHPPMEAKLVDEILYNADVSCEVAFIMPSLLPRYEKFRRMAGQLENFEEEVEPMPRRRTRSGSIGSLEGRSVGSQLDIKSKISRQVSEGMTIHEVHESQVIVFVKRSNSVEINYLCQHILLHIHVDVLSCKS